MTDRYRQRLAHAKWTWNEGKHCRFLKSPRRKDRESGRAERRSARQADRRETEAEAQGAVMDAPAEPFPCGCGDPICARDAYRASTALR